MLNATYLGPNQRQDFPLPNGRYLSFKYQETKENLPTHLKGHLEQFEELKLVDTNLLTSDLLL